MDYSQSLNTVVDAGTGNRMHLEAQATPSVVSDKDLNSIIWSLMEIVKAGGLVGAPFDPAVPATYTLLRQAIDVMLRKQAGLICAAGGTANALTGAFTPAVAALTDGLRVSVRAVSANTTTPTFAADAIGAKTIIKANGLALAVGDIAGVGHWLILQYDAATAKWVLLNPAPATSASDAAGADNSTRLASTGWVRTAMPAIATAAGFAASLGPTGYIKFPSWLGGWIVQWGSTLTDAAGVASFTYPIAFPNNILAAQATYLVGILTGDRAAVNTSTGSPTSIMGYLATNAGAPVVNGTLRFLVVGF